MALHGSVSKETMQFHNEGFKSQWWRRLFVLRKSWLESVQTLRGFTSELLHESNTADPNCSTCRRPAHLSSSGAGRPLLRWDQVPEIRRRSPSVDHRHRGERQPHGPHHRQTADHRGGAAGSDAECQPDSWCDLLMLRTCSVTAKDWGKTKASCSEWF